MISYDVIVIGSGIGGLTATLELAGQGCKVLVLEQHYLLGGACTTYTRKGGYQFDAGVESISGVGDRGPIRHLLRRHNMESQIVWLRNRYEYRDGTQSFVIPDRWEAWRDQLMKQYPDHATDVSHFFTDCRLAFEEAYQAFAPDRVTPYLPQTPEEFKKYATQFAHLYPWLNRTWGDYLDAYLQSEEIKRQLSILTTYVGDLGRNTPAKVMFSLMGYFIDGGYRPQGGSGQLAEALVRKIREYGGEVQSKVDVKSIRVENGRVIGVETVKGILYRSSVVISNVDPRVTYEELLDQQHVPQSVRDQVTALRPSMSLYVWTAALSCPFFSDRLTSVHGIEPHDLARNDITVEGYGFHSSAKLDPSLAPARAGNVIINLRCKANASRYTAMNQQQYLACKRELDEYCRQLLTSIDPEASKNVIFSEVATPKSVQYFMRTYEGSVYSTVRDMQAGFPEYRTHVRGLYLTGAGVGYGPGIEAVVISGAKVAELVSGEG